MKPKSYTRRGDKITYHYTFKQLREFLTHGFKEGNNGMILIGQDDEFSTYRGFGTIENPWRYVATVDMQYDPMYDGKRPDPEEVLNPPETSYAYTRTDMILWDASRYK